MQYNNISLRLLPKRRQTDNNNNKLQSTTIHNKINLDKQPIIQEDSAAKSNLSIKQQTTIIWCTASSTRPVVGDGKAANATNTLILLYQ